MTIFRGPRPESNFYLLDKRISEDDRLSWAARGLLIFLLGKPDHWKVSIQHLKRQTLESRIRTGRDGVYALLKELEAAGYVRTIQKRSVDGRGFGGVDYLVSEFVCAAEPEAENVPPDYADTPPADTPQATLVSTETAARNDNPLHMGAETKVRKSDRSKKEGGPSPKAMEFANVLCKSGYPIAASYKSLQPFIDEGGELEYLISIIGCVDALGPEDAHKKTAEYVIGWGRREMGYVRQMKQGAA